MKEIPPSFFKKQEHHNIATTNAATPYKAGASGSLRGMKKYSPSSLSLSESLASSRSSTSSTARS